MVQDDEHPSLEEIRDEIYRCVDLINQGSAVSAVTRLTKLGWVMEGIIAAETPNSVSKDGRVKRKPLFAWEHEDGLLIK